MRDSREDLEMTGEEESAGKGGEVERLRRMLLQSSKLAELGTQVAALVHEMNQPLVAIRAFAQMIRAKPLDEPTARRAALIEEQAEVLVNLINRISAHARPGSRAVTSNLTETIDSVVELLDHVLRRGRVDLDVEIEPNLVFLPVDEIHVQQILVNLVTNAVDAVEEKEDRRVRISARTSCGSVWMAVEDSGPGIPEELVERVLEPFFTTKDPKKGTGLGLAICREIVGSYGGEMVILSGETILETGARGFGTKIEVRFPSSAEHPSHESVDGGTQ